MTGTHTSIKGQPFIAIDHLKAWIGKTSMDEDILSSRQARLMAATLGLDQNQFSDGVALPPLWHWIYFLKALTSDELGRDGHSAKGGFLPPVPLENRMWAGGRLEFLAPVVLGSHVRKCSEIISIEHKKGSNGDLVFVTVRHEILDGDVTALIEEHDIVYKQPTPPVGSSSHHTPPHEPIHMEPFEATSTMLFRYSALTFNGHRIHYDQDYCRNVEGYENLVIHGPLQATLLAGLATRLEQKPLKRFSYRAIKPTLLGTALTINAADTDEGRTLWTAQADGSLSMRADAAF